MKILVINTGSSSIKYQLFHMKNQAILASGKVEKIGEEESLMAHEHCSKDGGIFKIKETLRIADHREGFHRIVELLFHQKDGIIEDKSEITAVGHRVVHGGEAFQGTRIVDEDVIAAIKESIPLAPLHNPSNLLGIEIARTVFPEAPQVAVFDTAFHQTIPEKGFLYAIPYEWYEKHRIRRYGFHGTSHAYVSEKAAQYLGKALRELNLITIHLGNGASMAAIKEGRSIDTSMGMTPLAGLVMGTRSGDVDPALPFFLSDNLGMTSQEIDQLLNHESGLKGLCGTNDMREVIAQSESGNERAQLALDIYTYRIKKYIGAYFAVLERLDAIVFTAGIGENSPMIRAACCRGLERLGIQIDPERNEMPGNGVLVISGAKSAITVLVISTNEELRIAQETKEALELA
jgi:acetate kinase